ncbi:universal stress protein [Actinomycetospora termitidis]|uniref:Universal stress protein n=1 Tax=Actinomycetospora termitidis TaxID=3053470 RepID=A0ABT7MC20_9PSEU|nr:universal stress protein [Actinomycetospora sp. Odt1-22]MDL5158226.1 universal stress protein [Actinomycetospora sp. Odt1-22]
MTLLVGLSPEARDDAGGAIGLAARLAGAWDEDLTVAVVVTPGTETDPATADGGDPEPPAIAHAAVDGVLAGTDLAVRWTTVRGRSVADALVEAAGADGVSAIVLGTDPDRSGRIAVRVARSSPVPVVLARGTGAAPGMPVTRVTCAFDGTTASSAVLAAAADLARRSSATLRVASFAVRRRAAIPPEVGLDAEEPVIAEWSEQIGAAQKAALAEQGLEAETGVHAGAGWDEAVHAAGWTAGDLLVVGGTPGAATRFFLGDRVGAILAAAPVPAVIVRGERSDG